MTDPDFPQQLRQLWATHYNVPPTRLTTTGTTSVPMPDYQDLRLVLYNIEAHTFAQHAPPLTPHVEQVIADFPNHRLTVADFLYEWGAKPTGATRAFLYALNPDDFQPAPLPEGYTLRSLTTQDADALMWLKGQTPEEEVEEAEIGLDDDTISGVFNAEGNLVAVSSTYNFRGMTDPGVLTHPDYRGRGLGKAVVSAIIAAALARNEMITYRAASDNIGSIKIAQSLGYQRYITINMVLLDALPKS